VIGTVADDGRHAAVAEFSTAGEEGGEERAAQAPSLDARFDMNCVREEGAGRCDSA
jgi:hypothetical protein